VEVKLNRSDIKNKLDAVCQVTGSKMKFILSSVKIIKVADKLELHASNGTISIITSIKLTDNDNSEGGMVVNAKELASLVDSAPEKEIKLIERANTIDFVSGDFVAKLSKLPLTDYPEFKLNPPEDSVAIGFSVFREAITKVLAVVDENSSSLPLCGVYFKGMYVIASDGKMSTFATLPVGPILEVIVPVKLLNIVKGFERAEENILISVQGPSITFKYGDTLLAGQVVDAKYPDIVKAISAFKVDLSLKVDKTALLDVLDRATLFTSLSVNKAVPAIKFEIIPGKDKSTYRITSVVDGRQTVESHPCVSWTGDKFESTFNVLYLKRAVSFVQGEVVSIRLGMPSAEGRRMPIFVDEDDKGYHSVIMAMK